MSTIDSIPPDTIGRAMWALKYIGTPTVLLFGFAYYSYTISESIRADRKESDTFIRTELRGMNEQTIQALTNSTEAVEQQVEQSEELMGVVERNTDAFEKVHEALKKE